MNPLKLGFTVLVAVLLLACSQPGFDNGSGGKSVEPGANYRLKDSNHEIMTLNELSDRLKKAHASGRALKGHGKTVFFGTKPVEFEVEVIDIIDDFIAEGYDVIFFRFDSPYIRREDSSIVAGMSGSPIFVDDKIVGALAYGYNWGRVNNRVGYATPIEYMLQELDTRTIKPTNLPASSGFASPTERGLRSFLPIYVSGGLTRGFQRRLEQLNKVDPNNPLKDFEFVGSTGSSRLFSSEEVEIEPGSVIGVELVGGDISLAGVGTATYVTEDKVLAFGHPMLRSGTRYQLPMTTGHISGIIALFPTCWKEGSATRPIGTLDFDGMASINGTVGRTAPTIPAVFSYKNELTGEVKRLDLNFAQIKEWLPRLVWMTVYNGYGSMIRPSKYPIQLVADFEGTLNNGTKVKFGFEERSSAGYFMEYPLFFNLNDIVSNPHKDVKFSSFDVNYTFKPIEKFGCIKAVWTDHRLIMDTSQPVRLKVLLNVRDKEEFALSGCADAGHGYSNAPEGFIRVSPAVNVTGDAISEAISSCTADGKGKDEVIQVNIELPEGLKPDDTITITVSNNSLQPERIPPDTFEALLKNMQRGYSVNDIIVRVATPKKVYYYKGEKLYDLPDSELAKMIGEVAIWENTRYFDKVTRAKFAVNHSASITLKVR